MISTVFAAIAMVFAVTAVAVALFAVRFAKEKSARSLSLKRMVALESQMTDIAEALDSVRSAMHKIRSRINMREKRAENGTAMAASQADDEPNPDTDPEGWYKWARRKHLNPSNRSN